MQNKCLFFFNLRGNVSKGEPSPHAQRKLYGLHTALCQDLEDYESTLIPAHPSARTYTSSLSLLEHCLFQQVLSIVATPGPFLPPSSGQLLLPLSPRFLPLIEKQ